MNHNENKEIERYQDPVPKTEKKTTKKKSKKIQEDKDIFKYAHSSGYNPGSNNAIDKGCICPVLDNSHGKGSHFGDLGSWWMTEGCPIHGRWK